MRKITTIIGAGVLTLGTAVPGFSQPAPGTNGPQHETGQLFFECEEDLTPGQAGDVHGKSPNGPGSAFVEGGNAGQHYAGEQPGINDKNTSSVSQYDTACARSLRPLPR